MKNLFVPFILTLIISCTEEPLIEDSSSLPNGVAIIEYLDDSSPIVNNFIYSITKSNSSITEDQLIKNASELVTFTNSKTALLIPFNVKDDNLLKTLVIHFKSSSNYTYFIQEVLNKGSNNNTFTGEFNYIDSNNNSVFNLKFENGKTTQKIGASDGKSESCMDNCTSSVIDAISGDWPANIACMLLAPSCAAAIVATCVDICYFD